MRITASAPGKFVLAGEYAVLDGAPAICVAVDRRAVVTVGTHDGDHHVVSAPGFTAATGRFRVESGKLSWLDGGRDFGLLEAVWNASRPATAGRCLAISLDTAVFRDPGSGSKIGLGSSAALTVALATALDALGGDHRLFQGGAGSGVDIACSIAGGTVEYRLEGRQATPVEWPAGLYFSVFWSGISAATGGRLARFADQPGSPSRSELSEASASVAAAFERGQAAEVIAALGAYTEALLRFDAAHGLGIFDAGHKPLAERAAEAGIVYKPCGAGGGDIGVALATSRASLASFEKTAARSGFKRLALSIDPRGALLHDKDEM
jgi:phosphomevalonate kinase